MLFLSLKNFISALFIDKTVLSLTILHTTGVSKMS